MPEGENPFDNEKYENENNWIWKYEYISQLDKFLGKVDMGEYWILSIAGNQDFMVYCGETQRIP